MAEQLTTSAYKKENTLSLLNEVSHIFSNSTANWEKTIEESFQVVGDYFNIDQIESVIKSTDKSHKYIVRRLLDSSKTANISIKEEGRLINFLFRNSGEDLFYFHCDSHLIPPQLKKILRHRRLASVALYNMAQQKKKLGYIAFSFNDTSRELSGNQLELIKAYGVQVTNFIANQQQGLTIKRLVEKNSEQDRRLKEFAFITSHHLRAFSSNLAGLTEYLLVNPNEQRFIQMISNSVKKLNGSIEDINGILTHDNDLIVEEMSKVRLGTIISKIIEWHQKAIDANAIEIENLLPRRLKVYTQLEMLENIFSHIFSNAIKYGTNKVSKKIRIDHTVNDEYIIVRIRDFGDGIDMKKYGSKLFKAGSRFSKSSNTNLGMGLFLSKYQIQKLGGRIHLKSEPGKGTSVQCYLPAK